MSYETIRVSRDARGVANVRLARPEKHNAMNAAMIAELTEAALQLGRDPEVRVVVLDAEGQTFCAGGDLGWMREQATKDRAGKITEAGKLAQMLAEWNRLPKPVIGCIRGAAYGGGLGLVSICDIAIAEEGTRFALTETRLGLIPATIGPYVVRRLGEGFARQVFFNSKPFGTAFLLRAGALARTCSGEEMDAVLEEEIVAFLHCAPQAVSAAKALCQALGTNDPVAFADMSAAALADRWESEEAIMGISAFFSKKAPPWAV